MTYYMSRMYCSWLTTRNGLLIQYECLHYIATTPAGTCKHIVTCIVRVQLPVSVTLLHYTCTYNDWSILCTVYKAYKLHKCYIYSFTSINNPKYTHIAKQH